MIMVGSLKVDVREDMWLEDCLVGVVDVGLCFVVVFVC